MDADLTDTERLMRDTFRSWHTTVLAPHVPAMEDGTITPYALMRTMHRALGLDAMLPRPNAGTTRRSDAASTGIDANVARYARTTFVVEMARVSPSFALSWGASTGLFGANVLGKGTPEQIERFAMPVLRSERIGAWGLTEPSAGSDA
jgi:alkylation response protein AidB-like acyl-CoA dehydrogenase